jgi:mono/diheme cytochrome c family protein
MPTRVLIASAFLILMSVVAAGGEQQGNPVEGKRLYLAYGCYGCHGTTGAGGGIAGPKLAPNPLPLEGIRSKLRTASGRMPVYAPSNLKDSEIADIVTYLQSIPAGPAADDISLLKR